MYQICINSQKIVFFVVDSLQITNITIKTNKMNVDKQTLYDDDLLNTLPDGVLIFNSEGEVLQLNLQAKFELHISIPSGNPPSICVDSLFNLLNYRENIFPTILESLRNGQKNYLLPEHTFIQEKTDYTQFPVSGKFTTLREEGKLKAILFFFRNITLELTQEYILNTALQKTKIYPWFYDIAQSKFTLDHRYFEYLGYQPGKDNTLTMEEYVNRIHPDDRAEMAEAFVIQLSGTETFDKSVPFRIRRGDGTWEWFEGQSTYIANVSGHPYRLVGICMSIQEYKDIENTLIEARMKAEESDKLKMAFLANMSHEIRTPLNAIVGFSDVIGSTYEELTKEEREDFIRLISINSEQLVTLIDDILDLSKIESNTIDFHMSNCSLKSFFMDIAKEQAVKAIPGIEIKPVLPDADLSIVTDYKRLKQVICNLINNARKFTEKGYIHFGFTIDESKENSVRIFVKDTGLGIPEENQQDIFERFYKVNTFKQGTGLGLPICKTIIEHLQGEIFVTSQLGKGSCFTVLLPVTTLEQSLQESSLYS